MLRNLTKRHQRVLYLIAKHGHMVRKTVISQATSRWPGAERDRVLQDLIDFELIDRQRTPGKHQEPPGVYYWLTGEGVEKVADIVDHDGSRMWDNLPDNWRTLHV